MAECFEVGIGEEGVLKDNNAFNAGVEDTVDMITETLSGHSGGAEDAGPETEFTAGRSNQ